MTSELGFEVTISQPYDQAIETVVDALKSEGFGILTRIDVQATLKEKLGQDFRPYVILGACYPPLAYRALSAEPLAGLLLPCNVTVEALTERKSLVQIVNPETMLAVGALASNPALGDVARIARTKLERVAQACREFNE